MRTDARKLLQHRHHVERRGIAIGILALRQRAGLLAQRAAGEIGDQFEQRVRRRRQRDVVEQHLAQRLAPHLGRMRGAEQRDDLVHQAEIVAGEDAEGIADDVIEAAAGQIKLDMPGFLFRALAVQQPARQEFGRRRIVARAAGFRDHRRRRCGIGRRRRRRRWRLVDLLIERLQHPRGFLAAGDAEIEPRLALAGDRFGIVMAVVAALAAILLRHRRHELAPQRPAFGELHAIGDRHGLVVPGRLAVVAIAHDGGALFGR